MASVKKKFNWIADAPFTYGGASQHTTGWTTDFTAAPYIAADVAATTKMAQAAVEAATEAVEDAIVEAVSDDEMVPLCLVCADHHVEEDECPTVKCSDCGCSHTGTVDQCVCEDGYCDECECDNSSCEHCSGYETGDHNCCECDEEPENLHQYMGCDACKWHYDNTGEADSCGGDGLGEVNPHCCYAEAFYDSHAPESVPFSIVTPETKVEPHEVTEVHEAKVAIQLGLSPDIDLSVAAADFYILERLYDDLHDRTSTYDPERGRFTLGGIRPPADFGSDSKLERLAYDVANTRTQFNQELARQFRTYLIMAVGGEIRHAVRHAWKDRRNKPTPKRLWPKSEDRAPWKHWGYNRELAGPGYRKYGCPACVWAKKKFPNVHPCTRIMLDKEGNHKKLPATQANPNCGYLSYWAEAHGIITEKVSRETYVPHNNVMKEFFKEVHDVEKDRGIAWREWAKMHSMHGADLLQECVRVFKKWSWNGSFGGSKWGDVAEFTMLYERGKMSDSAFIDRAWTLEHNGGCVFNKFWMRGLARLKHTLDTQASDERHYPTLRKSASEYVKGLLSQYEALTGGTPRPIKVYVNA